MKIYQESAIDSWLFDSGSEYFKSDRELIDLGMSAVSGTDKAEAGKTAGIRHTLRWPVLRVAAVCMVLAALAVLYFIQRSNEDYTLNPGDLSPVRSAVRRASQYGPFILPEGAGAIGESVETYRSGYIPLTDSLSASIGNLHKSYRGKAASAEVAYWLIAGEFVTGHIDIARDLASDALEDYPSSSDIAVLKALILYTDDEYDSATDLLREVLAKDPGNMEASVNLAIILADQGNTERAMEILSEIIRRYEGSPYSRRAKEVLTEIPNRR